MSHALSVLEFPAVLSELASLSEISSDNPYLLELSPSFDPEEIRARLEKTSEGESLFEFDYPSLKSYCDVVKPVKKAAKSGVLSAYELAEVGMSLKTCLLANDFLSEHHEVAPQLFELCVSLPRLPDIVEKLERSVSRDDLVQDEASQALRSLRQKKKNLAQQATNKIQSYVSGRTRDLLSDPIATMRNGRHVIPLKAEHKGKIRGIVHDSSATGQTIYVEPDAVVELGNKLREAEVDEKKEVQRILAALSAEVGSYSEEIVEGLNALLQLDLVFTLVRYGKSLKASLPQEAIAGYLRISEGRHPLLPQDEVVPLDIELGGEIGSVLITGPNTGGKTVAIKTVGLFVAMAQCGMMVPAKEAEIGYFSQIWADIGDEQSLEQSLSTFSGHIKNISHALIHASENSLVLLDEVGAGTDPAEGSALAKAILEEFHDKGSVILASTHYGELKIFAANADGFTNGSMEFDLKSLRPTYRFLMGTPGSSHAMKIAKRYGVSEGVIERAEAGFSEQEQDVAKMIERLEQAQKQAQRSQSEADRLAHQLRKVENEAKMKLEEAESAKKQVRSRAVAELEELLRELRIEAAEIFDEVKKNPTQQGIDQARKKLKDLQEVGSSFSRELKPKEKVKPITEVDQLEKGVSVKVRSLGLSGHIITSPKGGKVEVQAGMIKSWVKVSDVEVIGARKPAQTRVRKSSADLKRNKSQNLNREVNLRHMRAEDAEEELLQFIDDALVAGFTSVRILHGKGEGVLRKMTREILKSHAHVAGFEDADASDGGHGVTVARLK